MMKRLEAWLYKKLYRAFHENCLIGDKPFFDKSLLEATGPLESSHPIIRQETLKILERYEELTPFQTMSPDQEFLSDDDRWKFFFLKCVNIRFKKNCALMPETMKVIDRCPEIIAAYLSILAPGKTLPPHEGPWSGVLRAHLGVIVPKAKSLPHNPHIIVDGQRYDWSEGKVVYFDDTYTHEAHNPTDGIRVVLFLDVIRPMSPPWSWINRFILSVVWLFPYVWVPYFRHKKWEKKFHG